jgi:hypothetical protein
LFKRLYNEFNLNGKGLVFLFIHGVCEGDIDEERLTDLFFDGFLDFLFILSFEFFSVGEVLLDFLLFEADEILL